MNGLNGRGSHEPDEHPLRLEVWQHSNITDQMGQWKTTHLWGVYRSWEAAFTDLPPVTWTFRWSINKAIRPRAIQLHLHPQFTRVDGVVVDCTPTEIAGDWKLRGF